MSLARDVTTVGGATLASRLLGFARDVGVAALLGAGVFSDAFFAVLQIANFFRRLLAEGALNAAFVPLWLRTKQIDGENGAHRFFLQVLTAMLLVVSVLAAGALWFAPELIDLLAPGFEGERHALATEYLRIVAPYVALAGVVAVLAAALNAQGRVVATGLGAVAFNVVLLLALAAIAGFGVTRPSVVGDVLSWAVVLAGTVQLMVTGAGFLRTRRSGTDSGAPAAGSPQKAPQRHDRLRERLALSANARRFFVLAVPGLLAAGIPQLKLIAGAMVASSSQAAVSWLYYANRLYELPLGVVSIAMAAVLVSAIAASVRTGDGAAIAAAQSRGFELAIGLTLPSAVAFAVLAEPIAAALFERGAFGPRDTTAVAAALAAICAGLPGHALEKVFGAVSFAHEDTRTPMLAALAGLASAVIGSLALFPRYGHVGVAAAIAISGWVGAMILGTILQRRGWLRLDRDAARRLPRIVLAAVIMGLSIFAVLALVAAIFEASGSLARLVVLVVLVATGLIVYLASLEALGAARMRDLLAAVRHPGLRG
jgi:putative peptidoglycan lipid II flippase